MIPSVLTSVHWLTFGFAVKVEFKACVRWTYTSKQTQQPLSPVCVHSIRVKSHSHPGTIALQMLSSRKSAYCTAHPESLQPFLLPSQCCPAALEPIEKRVGDTANKGSTVWKVESRMKPD